MLYELIAIVRPGSTQEVRDIARTVGLTVLRGGGVIRDYSNWGQFMLPKPITKHQQRNSKGQHFVMRFDGASDVQQSIRRTLKLDPRMVRFGVVKMGSTLEQIKHIPGKVDWNNSRDANVTL